MNELLNLVNDVLETDRYLTNEEYSTLINSLSNVSTKERSKILDVLLIEIVFSPEKLNLEGFKILSSYIGKKKYAHYLSDLMTLSYDKYGKEPIFKDANLYIEISKLFQSINRHEYMALMALLNNGFGDKNEIKKYLSSVDSKVFNYSTTWKLLYLKSKQYLKES